MPNSQPPQIDIVQIKSLFGGLDSDTQELLLDAAAADFNEWTEKLIGSWAAQDVDLRQRSRHSLKGLCGNFGAVALLEYCDMDLSHNSAVHELRVCRDNTLRALGEAARN